MFGVEAVDVKFQKLGGVTLKLLKVDNEIDLISAGYLLQRFDSGCRINTVKKDSQAIANLYRFCIDQGFDLHNLIRSQTPISIGRIEEFSSYCSMSVDNTRRVSPQYYSVRMRVAWSFIKWLWSFYINRKKQNLNDLKSSKLHLEVMETGFKLYLKAPYAVSTVDRIGLRPDLRSLFIDIINPLPDNELNPWKSERIRWRNYALLLTMILGGNRKGESLLLEINHFCLVGRKKYFEIIAESDEVYPRSEAPSVKTLGRQVSLSDGLASIFEHYITIWRKKFNGANSSRYAFLSGRDDKPLSVSTPNVIINTLIEKHPQFKDKLSPHILRNTFHDLLNDSLDETYSDQKPMSRKMSKALLQEYAGGWVKGSEMPRHYSKGSIQARVASVQRNIQSLLVPASKF